jgi:hypothetical protein
MVFPHRACGCAAGAAPIPVYRWDLTKRLKPGDARRLKDKVAAGRSPAAHAKLPRSDSHGACLAGPRALRRYDWLPL